MTTTVTIKTHSRPAVVDTHNYYSINTPTQVSQGSSSSSDFLAPDSERQFVVTDTQTVSVRELPEGATDLHLSHVGATCGNTSSVG